MPDDETHFKKPSHNSAPMTDKERSSPVQHESPEQTPQHLEAKIEPSPEPVAAPIVSHQSPTNDDGLQKVTPGILVLQWLTYAFWGWTVLSLAILIAMVVGTLLNNGINSDNYGLAGGVAYVLAAVIVLFIISIATDLFYSKAEKNRAPSTGSNVIMIIHAVLFALFGIGSLISAVFGGVQLLIGESTNVNESLSVMFSGIIVAALYGVTLLRVLRPLWIKNVVTIYWAIMTGAVIIATILGVTGPAMQSRLLKEDQVIESSLPDVSRSIAQYANKNSKLPASLNELSDLSADSKKLVDGGKVKYTAKERIAKTNMFDLEAAGNTSSILRPELQSPVFQYELCVDYKTGTPASNDDASKGGISNDLQPIKNTPITAFDTTPVTYGHKAGNVCYDLQTRSS